MLSTSCAGNALPWAFKGKVAEGYSLDLVSVEPTPGTPLVAGTSVEFKVAVTYSMTIAEQGVIILVFQDETNRSAKPTDAPQVKVKVHGARGSVNLSDTVLVPRGVKELRLFIPLVPEGLKETNGEITLRYPIKKGS